MRHDEHFLRARHGDIQHAQLLRHALTHLFLRDGRLCNAGVICALLCVHDVRADQQLFIQQDGRRIILQVEFS